MELTHGGKTAFFDFAGKLHNKFPPEKWLHDVSCCINEKIFLQVIIKQNDIECNRNRRKIEAPFFVAYDKTAKNTHKAKPLTASPARIRRIS
ncbi:MAG: hypothetical protein PUC93_02715, partial [Oscillospiraceae bacterium]|nr:hypothetical protein [Oscillospiraceae bacterium]